MVILRKKELSLMKKLMVKSVNIGKMENLNKKEILKMVKLMEKYFSMMKTENLQKKNYIKKVKKLSKKVFEKFNTYDRM